MLEKYLQEIGLNEKEAAVYTALLQVDSASVIDLSKKTEINRSTTYVVLDSLAKKGLVSETTVGKKTHYQAEPPERLETYVERQKMILEEQARRLKDIVPQLKSLQRESGERPVVKFFEGREGIVSANEEFFSANEDGGVSYMLYPKNVIEEIFTKQELSGFRSKRIGKNIKSKVLYTYKDGDLASDETGDRIKIDATKYPISCDVSIYKDKVRIGIFGKSLSAIFIKSQDLAETLKSLFDLVFDKSKEN